ncbi:MAG: hypothetical protein JWR19_4381 [Pedosphaera sp.]|jgi:hypothetical protein|nr:hypothetical protein [Pedosphaera sp.]
MNILIEDAESLEFLKENGKWTKKPADGKKFANTQTAFAAAKAEPIHKFNIVCYFPGTMQFVNLDQGNATDKTTSAA